MGAVQEAKVLLKACSGAASVAEYLAGLKMTGEEAVRDLVVLSTLCKEAESEAEQALRPLVSSAETFKWSVNLISTDKVRQGMSCSSVYPRCMLCNPLELCGKLDVA